QARLACCCTRSPGAKARGTRLLGRTPWSRSPGAQAGRVDNLDCPRPRRLLSRSRPLHFSAHPLASPPLPLNCISHRCQAAGSMNEHIPLQDFDAIIFDLGGVILELSPRATIERFSTLLGMDARSLYTQGRQDHLFDQFERGEITEAEFRA